MKIKKLLIGFIISCLSILLAASASVYADEPRKSQYFCGGCHVLTYPDIIQKAFENWRTSKHRTVSCAECHYPQPEKGTPGQGVESVGEKSQHFPKSPPKHFSFITLGGETIKTRAEIENTSCVTSKCHGDSKGAFYRKKIKYKDKTLFSHGPHLTGDLPKGIKLNCTSCHQHESYDRHFEVRQDACMLCHFKNTVFNEGRSRCELCHDLSDKKAPSTDADITHEEMIEANAPCGSCHYEVIQAAGGPVKFDVHYENGSLIAIQILGAGVVKQERCRSCHDRPARINQIEHPEILHKTHVISKTARCFDCHEVVKHAKRDITHVTHDGCVACHADPHLYQHILISGSKDGEAEKNPDPMFRVRTNCFGCHADLKINKKGLPTLAATARTCNQCHGEGFEEILTDWKEEMAESLNQIKTLKRKAERALLETRPSKEQLQKAKAAFDRGSKDIKIVEYGNGVHNVEYAAKLLEEAKASFEEMLEILKKD